MKCVPRSAMNHIYALQEPQQGTAHAVEVALPHIPNDVTTVLVLYSDTPLLTTETLASLLAMHRDAACKDHVADRTSRRSR